MQINKLDSLNSILEINKSLKPKEESNFSQLLTNAIDNVNQLQLQSEEYKKMLAVGEVDNLHDVTIAAEKANVTLQITMSIRNKVIEAYKEIMRMQF